MTGASDSITTREALIGALEAAAELEHSVVCQYLYAAHSLKSHPSEAGVFATQLERVREWQSQILTVARGEMEHLGLVCNLLSAVGAKPCLRRRNFPHGGAYCPPGVRFELRPFSRETMQRFASFEQSHSLVGTEAYETIGDLYTRIRDGFAYLDRAETLFTGPSDAQVSNRAIGLPDRWYDMELREVSNIGDALEVIDRILESGEHGVESAHPTHHELFMRIIRDFDAMTAVEPSASPVRDVVSNPVMPDNAADGCTVIDHSVTVGAAALFNSAYETMILMMERYYTPADETDVERETLENLTLFPIMTVVLRPLAELLTHMPVTDGSSKRAGPPFVLDPDASLPSEKTEAWKMIDGRLRDHADRCTRLHEQVTRTERPWAARIEERLSFLRETFESIAVKFDFYMRSEHGRFWTEYRKLGGR